MDQQRKKLMRIRPVLIILATIIVFSVFLSPVFIKGQSMEPTYTDGGLTLINRLSYLFATPTRGEVVAIKFADRRLMLLKRIVGLPGEKVEIKQGAIYIFNPDAPERFVLKEDYLVSGLKTAGNVSTTLGSNDYFVLGDNRNYSYDSRSWGTLDKKYIVGLARLRLFPVTEAKVFNYTDVSSSFNLAPSN